MSFNGTHRIHPKLKTHIAYRRRFAFWPTKCSGRWVWLKYYMEKYKQWIHGTLMFNDIEHIENITEADYIVRKLSESL